MNQYILNLSKRDSRKPERDEDTQVTLQQMQHYSNEGSEFLDDAIRTVEQPLMRTEEAMAAGTPGTIL